MARLRAEVKNLHLPGCPDPNAEKYQALSLAVEKLPPVEQLLAQWLPDAAGRCLVLCEDDAAAAQTAEQAEKLFGAGTHIYKDAEGFAADEAATLRLLVCANGPACRLLWPGSRAWCWCAAALDRPHTGRCWHAPLQPAAVCRWQS